MNIQDQQAFFQFFTQKMSDIMLKKGNDYSNEDRLSNFKLSGSIVGQSGEQCCLNLIAVKVSRLGQLIGTNKIPNNESVQDTLLDLANYTILLAMLIEENISHEVDEVDEDFIPRPKFLINEIQDDFQPCKESDPDTEYFTTKEIMDQIHFAATEDEYMHAMSQLGFHRATIRENSCSVKKWVVKRVPLPF